jgi:hypothetical protein
MLLHLGEQQEWAGHLGESALPLANGAQLPS